jgi:hypothetical protein
MFAARLREIASQVERGERVPVKQIMEGLEVHRRFLVGIHHRREEMIAAAVGSSAGPSVAAAFGRCAREHPKAVQFESEVSASVDARPFGPTQLKRIAALFAREADRILEHDRDEDENIHRMLHPSIPPAVRATLVQGAREIAGEAAAAEARLTSWTSHSNAAAD